jgi:hypothetical protein
MKRYSVNFRPAAEADLFGLYRIFYGGRHYERIMRRESED